ncbi:MAG: hypothetical protein N2691_06035 [Patescibacteria group bacterium]|nr:hypothetical protein [Patescibacteria group bacterium]
MKTDTGQSGFTLVEFLLYTGLLTVVIMVVSMMFSSITEIQIESESTSAISQDESFLVNRFAYDIRRAEDILLPAREGDSSSTLQLRIDGETYQYAIIDGNLFLTTGGESYRLNGDGTSVASVQFQRFGNPGGLPTVRYTIQLVSTALKPGESAPRTQTVSATVSLR